MYTGHYIDMWQILNRVYVISDIGSVLISWFWWLNDVVYKSALEVAIYSSLKGAYNAVKDIHVCNLFSINSEVLTIEESGGGLQIIFCNFYVNIKLFKNKNFR